MSIEQKIAELLAESKKLQAEEITVEGLTAEQFQALTEEEQASYKLDEETSLYIKIEEHVELTEEEEKELNTLAEQFAEDIFSQLDEAEKSPALKKAIASAWKQRAKKNRTADMAAGHKYTGMGNPKSHDWADNAEKKYKEKRERVNKLKEEITVDVSEDVAALINGEELTEEFKTKAATIFEAAVLTRVKAEVAKIEEQFESKLAEQVEEVKEGLVEKVDGYLNYVVEQWMTDNELALENGMKTDIMESFIAGMKNLFQEHYIEVPAEKYDLVGELEEEVQTTKSKLDEQLASNVELTKQINEMKRVSSIGEFCADLADTDAEKFKGLAEELAFEDAESFKTKLQTIKENYFGKKATVDVKSPVTDDPVHLEEETKTVDPVMAQYLAALK
jgi:hypothetical protein